jgi:uncharacterized protein (DUF1800 family)
MVVSRRGFLELSGAAAILASWGGMLGSRGSAHAAEVASRDDDQIYHFLNRIQYTITEADYELAKSIGIEGYLNEQLNLTMKRKGKVKLSSVLKKDRLKAASGKDASFKARQALHQGYINRTAFSTQQLYERMVEFWSDHFNITFNELEPDLVDFQNNVIRKHALGKFGDMVQASAKHPAMLFYLDNYLNTKKKPQENYARELMELHTIGVDGGYTEDDVKNVARIMTGWQVDDSMPGGFFFNEEVHDVKAKTVLGVSYPAGRGAEEGELLIDFLQKLPQTAHYISKKLCVRFVSDTPPDSLVDAMTAKWQETGGDIKEVLKVLFLSNEFKASIGIKFKRPLEWYAGVVRIGGIEFKDYWYQNFLLEKIGQIPYAWEQPNGYPDVMTAWANTNGLLERWNVAFEIFNRSFDKKSGIKAAVVKKVGKAKTVGELVDNVVLLAFGKPLDDKFRQDLIGFVGNTIDPNKPLEKETIETKLSSLLTLVVASPQFNFH